MPVLFERSKPVGIRECKYERLGRELGTGHLTILTRRVLRFGLHFRKYHAMDGHAMALALAQALIDALEDLDEHSNQDMVALLAGLQSEEDELHEKLRLADLPKVTDLLYKTWTKDPDLVSDMKTLWQGQSLCKTARLPALSRYLGYTTNTDKVGNFAVLGTETYDTGMVLTEAVEADAMNGTMRLVYEPGGKERQGCSAVLKPDYKDMFYAQQNHGLVKLTIPNEAEKAAYGYDPAKFKGLIIIFFAACDWGKCKPGDLHENEFAEGKFEVTVNGKPVKEMVALEKSARVLKGEEGLYWQASSNGDFELGFEVKEPGSFVKLSSVTIY
jgi:hypothetical protein